jgi:hypothetical protein
LTGHQGAGTSPPGAVKTVHDVLGTDETGVRAPLPAVRSGW